MGKWSERQQDRALNDAVVNGLIKELSDEKIRKHTAKDNIREVFDIGGDISQPLNDMREELSFIHTLEDADANLTVSEATEEELTERSDKINLLIEESRERIMSLSRGLLAILKKRARMLHIDAFRGMSVHEFYEFIIKRMEEASCLSELNQEDLLRRLQWHKYGTKGTEEREDRPNLKDPTFHMDPMSIDDRDWTYVPQRYMRVRDGEKIFIENVRIVMNTTIRNGMIFPLIDETTGLQLPLAVPNDWTPNQLYEDVEVPLYTEYHVNAKDGILARPGDLALVYADAHMASLWDQHPEKMPTGVRVHTMENGKKLYMLPKQARKIQDKRILYGQKYRYELGDLGEGTKYIQIDPSSHPRELVGSVRGEIPIGKPHYQYKFPRLAVPKMRELKDAKGNVVLDENKKPKKVPMIFNQKVIPETRLIRKLMHGGFSFRGSKEFGAPFEKDENGFIKKWWCYADNTPDQGRQYTIVSDWASTLRARFLSEVKSGKVNICECVEIDKQGNKKTKFQAYKVYANVKIPCKIKGVAHELTQNIILFCDINPISKKRILIKGTVIQKNNSSQAGIIQVIIDDESIVNKGDSIAIINTGKEEYHIKAAAYGKLSFNPGLTNGEFIEKDQDIGEIAIDDPSRFESLVQSMYGDTDGEHRQLNKETQE